ncbi:MAG: 5'-nucleotidase, lipoprotein e(P4) family [Thiogranum sp.]
MQISEEYPALSVGAYNIARQNLDSALEDRTWTALPSQVSANSDEASALSKLPPAVILDVDETVLSTLPYQAWLVKNDRPFTPVSWNAWVSEASAEAVPGALDFVHYAMEKGVTVFYLSNRAYRGALDTNGNGQIDPGEEQVDLKPFTISNLLRLGFLPQKKISNEDAVLLRSETGGDGRVKKGWASSDKTGRRETLSSDYRVVLIMGDSRNDFVSYRKRQDGGGEDIPVALDPYRAHWGRSWILLPNPIYGSWEKRLYDFRQPLSGEEKIEIKLDSLDTWR